MSWHGFGRWAATALVMTGATAFDAASSCARVARATTMLPITLDGLIRRSETAVVATPVRAFCRSEGGRIVTYTTLEVSLGVAGSVASGTTLTTRTYGGVLGTIGQQVPGEATLPIGRPALLFLTAQPLPEGKTVPEYTRSGSFVVTAMEQGDLPIVRAPDGQLRIGSAALGASVVPTGDVPARVTLAGRPLADVIADIRRRWSLLKDIH